MPLTDPELDLLREMLEDDPADDAFLQVGEELVRRARWAEAEEVLVRALGGGSPAAQPSRGFELLARAALETGHYDVALGALERVDCDPATRPENARVRILAHERAGRADPARALAREFLAVDPHDVVVSAVLERIDAPPPPAGRRGVDPFYTVDRAERYVNLGRPDRAIRVFRRIARVHPGDLALLTRIRQLQGEPAAIADDLSEELTDPSLVPEYGSPLDPPPVPIDMPSPRLSTPPPPARPDELPTLVPVSTSREADEEDTDLDVRRAEWTDEEPTTSAGLGDADPARRRRRRSLIRK